MAHKDEQLKQACDELRALREQDEREAPYGRAPLVGLHAQDRYKFLCLIGHAQADIHNAIFLFETFSQTENMALLRVLGCYNENLLLLLSELRKRQPAG